MSKKTVGASLLATILLLAVVQYHSTATAVPFNWTASPFEEVTDDASVATESNSDTSDPAAAPQKKKGNGFVRALSAPFRALGRLFGGSGKKNSEPQTARRSSDKDVPKFEGTTFTRIKDATSPVVTAPSTAASTTQSTASSTAEFERLLSKARE